MSSLSLGNHYKFLFDNSSEGIAFGQVIFEGLIPIDFVVLEVNKTFEKLTGLKNIIGFKVSDLFKDVKTDHPEIIIILGEVARTGDPYQDEIFFKPLKKWLTIAAFCPETGFLIVKFDDITIRKQVEHDLRASELKLKTILQNTSEAIGLHVNGIWKMCNPAALRLFAVPAAEQLIGTSLLNVIATSERDRIGEFIRSRMEDIDAPVNYLTRGLKFDGIEFEMEVALSSFLLENTRYVFAILRDITQRKLAESTLRKSEARYRLLFENMTNGFLVQEAILDDNNQPVDFKFLEANQYYKNFGVLDQIDIIGKTLRETQPDVDVDMIRRYCAVALTGEPMYLEYFSKTFGKYIRVNSYCPEKGIFASIFEDITERKLVESKVIQQNEELVKLNKDKDRFLSILAHDLKNPLSIVLSFVELLNKNIRKYDIEKIERFVGNINSSTQQVMSLLDDILLWARSESGHLLYEPVLLNYNEVCSQVVDILMPAAVEKQIHLNAILSQDIHVFADPNMFKTVLRNLISNAIKFTNFGGSIVIFAEQLHHWVTIAIEDNGVGLSAENVSKIFDITEKHSTRGTSEELGTGLGLVICKEFVEKHGGKIWVESQPDNGSVFYFTLPCDKA